MEVNGNTIENEHDLYVATVYNSPENSSYNINNENNDIFIKLQNKIATFSESELLLIGGDFNARTGNLADCLHEDEHDMKCQNFPNGYEIYKIRDRNNQDSTKNKYAEYLANFCITTNVHILNGRTQGDLSGEYTYCGRNGLSTVDYILTSHNLLNSSQIQYMSVLPITIISDHRLLTITINF